VSLDEGIYPTGKDSGGRFGIEKSFPDFSATKMKLVISAAAGWIGFYIADHALFYGNHVRLVASFLTSIGSAFAFR
jgi:hypothetical protein